MRASLSHVYILILLAFFFFTFTARAKNIQTSRPVFNTERMSFVVPHYGAEYKLEVVDANTDSPVGTALLSAQGLLQGQRDRMLSGGPGRLLLGLLGIGSPSDLRRVKIELRTGVRTGFGLDYLASTETSGWVEVDVRLDEDRSMFLSAAPRRCPPRDGEDFDVALIQLHIARIARLYEDVRKLAQAYVYVVSWESRELTSVSLVRWPLNRCLLLLVHLVFTFAVVSCFGSTFVFFRLPGRRSFSCTHACDSI